MPTADVALRRFDHALHREGHGVLIGVDEAGRGALAGPVVAGAVALPSGLRLKGLDDSKQLTPQMRDVQALAVRAGASAIGFAFVRPQRIDAINIRQASLLAMRRSIERLMLRSRGGAADALILIDGVDTIPEVSWRQRAVIGGDGQSLSIAAASVLAKTIRDRFMVRLAGEFPQYGFDRHKGYGTEEHLAAIDEHGPCRWHRFSYAPVARLELFPR